MSIPTITVTGRFLDAAGDPMSGTLSFRLNAPLVDSVGNIVSERVEIVTTLDSQGRITDTNGTTVGLVLYCTSGGDIAPAGLLYDVSVAVGSRAHRVSVALPSSLGSSVDWADIVPVPASTGVVWTVPDVSPEQARDLIGSTLVEGSGIDITVDDNADTVTLAADGTIARLASPALTGNPTAPTQTGGNSSTRVATTAFVAGEIATQHTADNGTYVQLRQEGTTLGAASIVGPDLVVDVDTHWGIHLGVPYYETNPADVTAGEQAIMDVDETGAVSWVLISDIEAKDTAVEVEAAARAAAITAHEADTTNVHGIADTSTLYRSGGTDVAVADGGTGASTASGARTNLGLVLGTDVEPHDPDLTTIAALDSSTAGALVTDGAGWIRKTYAQLKTALGLVKGDVGLGNVDNTSDANKPVSTAQQTAIDAKVADAINDGTTTVAPSQNAVFDALVLKGVLGATGAQIRKTGYYSVPPGGAPTTAIPNEATATYLPLWIDRTVTVDRIGAEVTVVGTSGAVVRLGIYSSAADGTPSTLVLDAGTISGTSATVQEITISQQLTPGLYWLCAVVQGGAGTRPTMRVNATTGAHLGAIAQSAAVALQFAVSGLLQTGVSGALTTAAITGGSAGPTRVTVRFA